MTSSDTSQSDKKTVVSTAKVGASAGAAVTSAAAASLFGSTGTLIGAAVGATVSTVASALYTEYLERAGERLRTTKDVVIQRIPGEVLATTPLRHLTSPTDLPGEKSMRAVGDEIEPPRPETVAVPLAGRTELLEAVDESNRVPPVTGDPDPAPDPAPVSSPGRRWVRPGLAAAGVAVAGFLIALGLVLSTEQAIGHPLAGGDSGNTLSNLGGSKSATTAPAEVTPTSSPSSSSDAAPTGAPAASPTADATAPAAPTSSPGAGTGAAPTGQPDSGQSGDGPGEQEQSNQGGATDAP
jgi:hypothetical protein